jgi:multiple sugar transport system substrate-binding protein
MSEKTNREEFQAKLEHMISTLRNQIINEEIKVGEYLPSEQSLAHKFNLSKNSVRKGLETLVSEGLIVKKSRVGNLVVSNKPYDQVILRVGYYPSLLKEAKFSEIVKQFEQAHPNIKVQTIALPYTHYHRTVLDFFKNDMIDVVSINYNDFCEFPNPEEIFEPVEYDENIYPFLQKPFESLTENKEFVRPFIFSPIILCYNPKYFKNNNLVPDSSWRWTDVLRVAKQLTEERAGDRHFGVYFHPLSLNRWPIFLLQNNVYFKKEDNGNVAFDGEKLMESVNIIRQLFVEQDILQTFLSDNDRDAEKLFMQEKVSMIVSSYFSLNEFVEADLDYDIAPLPYLTQPQTLLLIIGFAINKNSRKLGAAKKFVDFLSSASVQSFIRRNTLSIPAVKSEAEKSGDEGIYKPSRFQLFREIIPTYCLYSHLGVTYEELGEMNNELRLYLSGMLSENFFVQRLRSILSKRMKYNKTRKGAN